jgi:hypothetical protein
MCGHKEFPKGSLDFDARLGRLEYLEAHLVSSQQGLELDGIKFALCSIV